MGETIRVLEWNVNGLLHRQQELQVILDEQKIDVCLLAETHLTNQTYVRIRGYQLYHTVHPQNTARGGSAVVIKNNITHHEETKYATSEIQATAVTVKTKKQSVTFAAAYCPPRYNLKKENYLRFLRSLGERFIIGGDYNSKNINWGSRLTTRKGKELHDAIVEYGCEYHSTKKPTYWPTDVQKIPDLLDFFITKKISANYIDVEEEYGLNSDHSGIILTLSETVIKKESNPTLVNKYTNWEGFKEEINNNIELSVPLRTTEQLDEETENFMKIIQKAAWKNTPFITGKTRENNYPKEIRELIAEKRKARKRWQHTRAPTDKTSLNNLSQQLKREIQKCKNESFSTYMKGLSAEKKTEYSLWRATKKLKRPALQVPPIRSGEGRWAKSDEHKAELFADHLEQTFKPNEQYTRESVNNTDQLLPLLERGEEIPLVTPKEVENDIKNNINPRKAPGFDLITGLILKQLPRKGIVKLTNLINATFRLKHVPKIWKIAEVIMIQKQGKPPHEITSYRPISLLPVISKLFEKLILKRMKIIIERKNIIPTHQFGFREEHSTIDQVHRVTDLIEKALEEKKICAAIFLDVKQAFDKVWHKGLMLKLQTLLPKQYCQILKSYISGRLFRIKQGNHYSGLKDIKAGVPQGSVLGPVLYLLYTHDIPQTNGTTIATFADDTTVLAVEENIVEATNKLQHAINKISTWTEKWRIKLNETKSVHVNFTNRKTHHIPIKIGSNRLPHSNSAKYLGMTLDAKLRWSEHVKKKREELNIKYKKMNWLLGSKSQLSMRNKTLVYNQVLKPVWTYGAQLWGCASKSNIEIIQKFQNKVVRGIVDAPWYCRNNDIHKDLGVNHVTEEVKKSAKKHEDRLHRHVNVEVVQLLDNASIVRRLKRTKPFELV